jgi:hypothetical protein
MNPLNRLRVWLRRRRLPRLTLGAIPLPVLIPDAERSLKEIYDNQRKKGFKVTVFWEVLVLSADKENYKMQFYPVTGTTQDCLALGLKGRHVVRFIPIVPDAEEQDVLQKSLTGTKTFELTFRTEPTLMSREGLVAIGDTQGNGA